MEINTIEARNELVVLIGDLNKHVGSDDEGIEGNANKISFGGELLRKFLSDRNFTMVNKLSLTRGVHPSRSSRPKQKVLSGLCNNIHITGPIYCRNDN